MITIKPDSLIISNPNTPAIQESTRDSSHSFKKVLDETQPIKEKEKECAISIWELPSHHFNLDDEEEKLSIEEACGCNPHHTIQTPMMTAASDQMSTSSEIVALFENLVDQIELLSSKNETKTTFILNSSPFKNSPFYGTRITINEFSTAPKAFNIEIATTPTALILLHTHQAALMSAFSKGEFDFSIGRLDIELQENDRPLFHRKESPSDEEDLE